MSGTSTRPRWFFLITPPWLAWHAFAVAAAWGMLWLGDWQFHRAEGGNALSWAYTFEWPIFTAFGIVFWAKTVIDEYRKQGRLAAGDGDSGPDGATAAVAAGSLALPGGAHDPAAPDRADGEDDPELAAYNAYLARLNSRPAGR